MTDSLRVCSVHGKGLVREVAVADSLTVCSVLSQHVITSQCPLGLYDSERATTEHSHDTSSAL